MSAVTRAIAALLLAGATACAGSEPSATPATRSASEHAPGDVPAFTVDVERSRAAAGRGVLEVRLRTEDAPFEVTSLQLLDERFTAVPPADKSTPVRPGGVGIITPIPAGEVVCGAERGDGPRMAVTLTTAAGDAHELVVPVSPAGDEMLTGMHADGCRRIALLEGVDVAFGVDWTETSPATAQGTIRLTRRSATDAVVLEAVQGTVIFTLTVLGPVRDPVLTLPTGDTTAEVAVEVSAARCDPHALIESKKTYLFPMWVRTGDEEAVFLTVEPAGRAREAFAALLTEGCDLEEDAG